MKDTQVTLTYDDKNLVIFWARYMFMLFLENDENELGKNYFSLIH